MAVKFSVQSASASYDDLFEAVFDFRMACNEVFKDAQHDVLFVVGAGRQIAPVPPSFEDRLLNGMEFAVKRKLKEECPVMAHSQRGVERAVLQKHAAGDQCAAAVDDDMFQKLFGDIPGRVHGDLLLVGSSLPTASMVW